MIQFQLRTILFVTFVVAICGGIMRLSPIAGVPIAIAMIRSLRKSAHRRSNHWLCFVESIGLLLGLTLVTILSLIVSGFALMLMLAHGLLRGLQQTVVMLRRAVSRWRIASIPLATIRGVAICLAALLVLIRGLAVEFAIWLNKMNHSMFTSWSAQAR